MNVRLIIVFLFLDCNFVFDDDSIVDKIPSQHVHAEDFVNKFDIGALGSERRENVTKILRKLDGQIEERENLLEVLSHEIDENREVLESNYAELALAAYKTHLDIVWIGDKYIELGEMVDIYISKGTEKIGDALSVGEIVSFEVLCEKIKTISLKINIIELNLTTVIKQSDIFKGDIDSLMDISSQRLQKIVVEFEDSYSNIVTILSQNYKRLDENKESNVEENVERRVESILSNIFEFTKLRLDELGLEISMHRSELIKKNNNLAKFIAVMLNDIKKIENDLKEMEKVLNGDINHEFKDLIKVKNLADELYVEDVKKVDEKNTEFIYTPEAVDGENLLTDFVDEAEVDKSQSQFISTGDFKNMNLKNSLNENFGLVKEEENLDLLADFDNGIEIPSNVKSTGPIDENIADSMDVQNDSNIAISKEQISGKSANFELNFGENVTKDNRSNEHLIQSNSLAEEKKQSMSDDGNISKRMMDTDGSQFDTDKDFVKIGELNETINVDDKNDQEPLPNDKTTRKSIDADSVEDGNLKENVKKDLETEVKSWGETLRELVGYSFF